MINLLILFRQKYVVQESVESAKHTKHKLMSHQSEQSLSKLLEDLPQSAEHASREFSQNTNKYTLHDKLPSSKEKSFTSPRLDID